MQFKFATFVTLALATLAAATPTRRNDSGPSNQCNTGAAQCCESTSNASDPAVAGLLGLLGVVVQDVTAEVGLNCSPLTVVGASGTSCSAQPVCCTDTSFKGLIAIGCSPININA